eukprot:711103-Prorocentrum_minimum.AAC.1
MSTTLLFHPSTSTTSLLPGAGVAPNPSPPRYRCGALNLGSLEALAGAVEGLSIGGCIRHTSRSAWPAGVPTNRICPHAHAPGHTHMRTHAHTHTHTLVSGRTESTCEPLRAARGTLSPPP